MHIYHLGMARGKLQAWPEPPDMGSELGTNETDETCVDYLVGQFKSVLGQELVVKQATAPTTTRPSPLPPLEPLEPLLTVRSGPPPKMDFASTAARSDATIQTGPPAHMTPPPVLERGQRKERLHAPAVLPPLGQSYAPHDLIPTVVLRGPKERWPDLATDATTRRRFVEAKTVRYLMPRRADELVPRPQRADELVPLPHRGLVASRRHGTTEAGWEQPYASLEITCAALTRTRRGWPRLITGLGLAVAILALSGCTVYLLGLLE